MHHEAELVEEAAKGPHISLLCDGSVAVEINHFRCAIHGSCVALDLKHRHTQEKHQLTQILPSLPPHPPILCTPLVQPPTSSSTRPLCVCVHVSSGRTRSVVALPKSHNFTLPALSSKRFSTWDGAGTAQYTHTHTRAHTHTHARTHTHTAAP